jgi:hypothetical protein
MESEVIHRPEGEVDRVLARLIGAEVRVAAEAFTPARWHGKLPGALIPVRELILPDNRQAGSLPVYFEGRLELAVRRIGVVCVGLEAPASQEKSTEGVVHFQGGRAVILSGPAVVQSASPFRVEKLPSEPSNYWRDLHFPRVQFELPF